MVSIVTVNYNTKGYLKACLDSISKQSFRDFEVVVVDNASNDGSVEMVEDEYQWVKLIRNTKNELYCRGMNKGIKASQGEFVLGLNSDVILDRDFLKEARKGFEIDKRIGMVSGKILRMDGRTIDSTGLFLGKNRKPVERGYGRRDRKSYNRAGRVFGVNGAVGFYRRTMLESLSKNGEYFDETFGMFYEDLDLCWRANKRLWRGYYIPKAIVYHKRGGTSKSLQPKISFLERYDFVYLPEELKVRLIKNRYRAILKNDNLWSFLKDIIFIAVYEIKLWAYMLLYDRRLLQNAWKCIVKNKYLCYNWL